MSRRAGGGRRGDVMAISGRRAIAEAIRAGRARDVLIEDAGSTRAVGELASAARRAGVPVRSVSRGELDALAPGHRGVVARVEAAAAASFSERDLARHEFAPDAIVVVLDGVSDPQNLGAAARSAEAAGAAMLVSRVPRAAPVTPAAVGASAGALLHLPHARVANIARAIGRLQDAAFTVVGLDATAPSSIYDEPAPEGRVALVIGSEGGGMSRLAREACDVLVRLPMLGRVESLNASASLAAALYAYVVPARARASAPRRRAD